VLALPAKIVNGWPVEVTVRKAIHIDPESTVAAAYNPATTEAKPMRTTTWVAFCLLLRCVWSPAPRRQSLSRLRGRFREMVVIPPGDLPDGLALRGGFFMYQSPVHLVTIG
jgi:hypothetical protein